MILCPSARRSDTQVAGSLGGLNVLDHLDRRGWALHPWSGPLKAPRPATRAPAMSAPVLATTRLAKVETLKKQLTVVIESDHQVLLHRPDEPRRWPSRRCSSAGSRPHGRFPHPGEQARDRPGAGGDGPGWWGPPPQAAPRRHVAGPPTGPASGPRPSTAPTASNPTLSTAMGSSIRALAASTTRAASVGSSRIGPGSTLGTAGGSSH